MNNTQKLFLHLATYCGLGMTAIQPSIAQAPAQVQKSSQQSAMFQQVQTANNSMFIQNTGQWDSQVYYLGRMGGLYAWITGKGIIYDYFRTQQDQSAGKEGKREGAQAAKAKHDRGNSTVKGQVVQMDFIGATGQGKAVGVEQRQGHGNFIVGNDESKWASEVPMYDLVEMRDLYDHVHAQFYFNCNAMYYRLTVEPGADPQRIAMRYNGVNSDIYVEAAGAVVLPTAVGAIVQPKLIAYQEVRGKRIGVSCAVEVQPGNIVRLNLGDYDHNLPLMIEQEGCSSAR